MQELVVVDRLVKRYGPRFAVRDVSSRSKKAR